MKLYLAVLSTIGAIALTGCNTMEGLGRDVQRGGQAISQTSRDVRADWREARARNEREYDGERLHAVNPRQSIDRTIAPVAPA